MRNSDALERHLMTTARTLSAQIPAAIRARGGLTRRRAQSPIPPPFLIWAADRSNLLSEQVNPNFGPFRREASNAASRS